MKSREIAPDYMSISEARSGVAPLLARDPEPDYESEQGLVNTAFNSDAPDATGENPYDVPPADYAEIPGNNIPIPSTDQPNANNIRFMEETPSETATASSVVEISAEANSVERRKKQDADKSKDELLYRMSMAHLAPKGVNWGEEINKATELKDDSEIPTQILNALRNFPMGMSEKLAINNFLRNQEGRYSQFGVRLSMRHMTLGHGKHSMSRSQQSATDMLYSDTFGTLGFWDKPIAKVTALLGTNVASYFKFLRFLAVLNSWSAIIMFCFVTLPQIIPDDILDDSVKRGFFGQLTQTIFFYGAYSNTSVSDSISGVTLKYNRPLAYFLTWCSIYVLSVFFIVMIMFTTYRRSKQTFSDTSDRYSSAILMGWDHSVTNQEGCRLKASALTTYFREMKLEDIEKTKLSRWNQCSLYMVRGVCAFMSLAIMGGSGYLIYLVADLSMDYVRLQPSDVKSFFQKYQLTVLVSGLKIIIPPILGLLLYFEKYQPRTAIKVQLARTAVFYGASLMTFMISVYTMSVQCEKSRSPTNSSTSALRSKFLPQLLTTQKTSEYCCWENSVGEQLFQVVILDLLVNLVVGLLFMAGRALVVNKCFRFRMVGKAEFNVAEEILDLVYGQALIWLGLYSVPFLALVGILKLIVMFYFFFNMAAHFCDPPTSIFRASRSGGFFRFVLLVTLFLCMFPLTYMIVSLEPSKSCGPFKTRDRLFKVFTEEIGESPDWLRTIIYYVSTPAVVIPVILLLLLLVLYYRVKSSTQRKTAKRIRVQFKMKRQLEKKHLFSKNRLQRGVSRYQRI